MEEMAGLLPRGRYLCAPTEATWPSTTLALFDAAWTFRVDDIAVVGDHRRELDLGRVDREVATEERLRGPGGRLVPVDLEAVEAGYRTCR